MNLTVAVLLLTIYHIIHIKFDNRAMSKPTEESDGTGITTHVANNATVFVPDLDAYFARIGYYGPRDATLSTLNAIQWCNLTTVPFENLDVVLFGQVCIDPKSIEQKIVKQNRGGYCFEQNVLLYYVLLALGFDVVPLISRVLGLTPPEVITGNTHIILKVNCEGSWWLVDIGYGPWGSSIPLQIENSEEQLTPCDRRRIVQSECGRFYTAERFDEGVWMGLFKFNLDEAYPADWEVANWYSCTHKSPLFTNHIIVTLFTADSRYILFNKEFTVKRVTDGVVETTIAIKTQSEFFEVLHKYFNMSFEPNVCICPFNSAWEE